MEEQNGETILEEQTVNLNVNPKNTIKSCKNNKVLSHCIMPQESEEIFTQLRDFFCGEEGTETDTAKATNNRFISGEKKSRAVNNSVLLKTSFTTNDVTFGCDNEDSSLDKCESNEALLAKYCHISTNDTNPDCGFIPTIDMTQDDDAEETKLNVKNSRERSQNVERATFFDPEVDLELEECEKWRQIKPKHPAVILELTGLRGQEQEPVMEGDEDEEVKCLRDEEEKEKDLPPDSSQSNILSKISLKSAAQVSDVSRGPTLTRATFSPGDKLIQLPALFSGLRVLRKGVSGPEQDKQEDLKAQGSFLDQISQFLSREKRMDEKQGLDLGSERLQGEINPNGVNENECKERETQTNENAEVSESVESPKPISSAEAAFDAFKAFFAPKPLKKDSGEKADLEAMRKRMKNDKAVLKRFFENAAKKAPEKKDAPEERVRGASHTKYI